MTDQTIELVLTLKPGAETDEELEELTWQLQEELLEVNVGAVDLVSTGEKLAKTRSGDPGTWGMLLLTLAASGGVLTALINVLQSWLTRHDRRSLTLEIDGDKLEVSGISSEEQQRLIHAWFSRHTGIVVAKD